MSRPHQGIYQGQARKPLTSIMGMKRRRCAIDTACFIVYPINMRTFEYGLFINRIQRQQLMACLKDSRGLYNEMLAATKQQYANTGKFPFKYDLMAAFKGRGGETVPASTVQMLADRLDKALKRYLAFKEQGLPCGFPRFKTPNRWHSIQLRQHKIDFRLHEDGKHLCVPAKLGLLLKVKRHAPKSLVGEEHCRCQLGKSSSRYLRIRLQGLVIKSSRFLLVSRRKNAIGVVRSFRKV